MLYAEGQVNVISDPRISVCMATYNGERFIGQQISSILCQLGTDDELVISDDGSSDATCEVIKSFDDARIKLVSNPNPKSPIRNFEHALQCAQGEYLFLADQDDVWFETKVEVVTQLLQAAELVVTDCTLIDKKGRQFAPSFFLLHGSRPGFLANLIKNSYLGCCMAFRRSFLKKALPIPASVPMHDIWFGMLAECYGTPVFCPEPLMAYRRHSSSASTAGAPSSYTIREKIKFRYNLLFCLIQRIATLRLVP